MDPLSVIASTIAIIQAVSATYGAIQHLRGLPTEFNEVSRTLPLAQDTLRLAHDQLQGVALDESSRKALQPLVSACKDKAQMLQDIFESVGRDAKNTKDESVLAFYRNFLLRMGKAHRVETLMQGILKALDALATNQLFRAATQGQITLLEEAINQLANVDSSVPDSDLEGYGRNVVQHNASGATGYISTISGSDHKINSGSGKLYNAHTMNFVPPDTDYNARRNILKALHTIPYQERKNRNPDRVPGTCEWFEGHDLFQKWKMSKSSSMLWVSANPGCGKSVLAKYLVDSVLRSSESRTRSYFFFKDDVQDQKSASTALKCILHQIFVQRDVLFSEKIVKHFKDYEPHLHSSLDDLWDILIMVSQDENAGELVCIIDAFDECEDQSQRKFAQFLRKYYDTATKTTANLKFLITSRPYDKIGRGFHPLDIKGLPIVHLKGESQAERSKIAREIDIYIKYKVLRIRERRSLEQDEEELLLENLRRVPNQTYLWVYLTLELIESEVGIDRTKIKHLISSIPSSVHDAYEKILAKVPKPDQARKMLHIVVAATRPLTLAEMRLALTLKPSDKSYKDLDSMPGDRIHEYVTEICGLFVTITNEKIYLLHQTAKEFLVQEGDHNFLEHRSQPIWKSSLKRSESHSILFRICFWHLRFTEFNKFKISSQDEDLQKKVSGYVHNYIFLDYSALNWATHFRSSGIKDDAVIKEICDMCSNRSTWFKVYWTRIHAKIPRGFTPLMIAAYFGIERAVDLLLRDERTAVGSKDRKDSRSALSWASDNGFDGVVELIIKRPGPLNTIRRRLRLKDAIIDSKDICGRTPLSYAAWNGHLAVVRCLIEAGASVDQKDKIGGTPISYALSSGHVGVASELTKGAPVDSVDNIRRELLISAAKKGYETTVQRLLDNGATIEVVDNTNRTPLSYAAEKGHASVVKMLLDTGKVNVDSRDTQQRTPLLYATEKSHNTVVKMLLDTRKADVNARDCQQQTPLLWAIWNGHEAVLNTFSNFLNLDIDAKVSWEHTLLLWAAEHGNITVVKALLDCRKVDVDARDAQQQTPLSRAAKNGHTSMVKMLLNTRKVDVNARDSRQRTPLLWAATYGHDAVIKALLNTGKVDIDARDSRQRTPLLWAAIYGHDAVVKALLNTGKVNVGARDSQQQTPLSWAIRNGHDTVLSTLSDSLNVDIDAKVSREHTLLLWAAEHGNIAVVKALLDCRKVDVDVRDSQQQTPLLWAAAYGHNAVVKAFLDTEKVDVDTRDSQQQTPLLWAAKFGHNAVVKTLLNTGKVDVDARDSQKQTPLLWAAIYGHDTVVKALLSTGKVDVDARDSRQRTPLLWAATYGHDAVVKALLNTWKVNVNSRDSRQRTPLSYAAANGHNTVVKMLLSTGKVDVDARDFLQRTPLLWAAANSYNTVVNTLLNTGKTDVDAKDTQRRTPLLYAAANGCDTVVKVLLDTGKVDVDARDSQQRTPLLWAAKYGHDAVVKMLLGTGKVDVDARDFLQRAPLSYAAENGHDVVVKMLHKGTFR